MSTSPTALRTKLLTEKIYLRSCSQEVRSRAASSFPSLSPLFALRISFQAIVGGLEALQKKIRERRRPGRVVEEEEDEDGREKGQARSDAKPPSEVEESYLKENNFTLTSILMEPLRGQSQDHCQ